MASTVNTGALARFESTPARRAAPLGRSGIVRPLRLCAGDIVRIADAQGTLVHARSGVLWITDERVAGDIVLQAGGSHRIANRGTTIVEAQRTARIVIEVPQGVQTPASVELAFPGTSARRIRLMGNAGLRVIERVRLALARAFNRIEWPSYGEAARVVGLRRGRITTRYEPDDYTPEAVRDRLLGKYPFRYF